MAIAFNVATATGTQSGTNPSFSHNPGGNTPRGILVFIVSPVPTSILSVTAVTYGGVAMSAVSGSPNELLTGEDGTVRAYFLGASIPTGTQTVAITGTGFDATNSVCISVTAAADTEVVDTDITINSASLANPSCTLALAGRSCFCAIGFYSGTGTVGAVTPLTDWTSVLEADQGQEVVGVYRYNTIGTANVTAGWSQSADDALAIAVAIAEQSGTQTPQSVDGTLTSSGALLKETQARRTGTLTTAGLLAKQPARALTATLTSAGALLKQTARALTATLSSAGDLAAAKIVMQALTATLTAAGTLTKETGKALAGTLTATATLTRDLTRSLTATLTTAGDLTAVKTAMQALTATLDTIGTLTKETSRALAGTLSLSATVYPDQRRHADEGDRQEPRGDAHERGCPDGRPAGRARAGGHPDERRGTPEADPARADGDPDEHRRSAEAHDAGA
jgi:hypothetical protein